MKSSYKKLLSHIGILNVNERNRGTESLLSDFENKDEKYWNKKGETKALRLFHSASKHVPAYADFLKKHKVNPAEIKTIKDYPRIPITSKHNYIEAYPLKERLWYGQFNNHHIIATSSGTTGKPVLWPRSNIQESEALAFHELIYRELYSIHQKSTLIIIGFPMGVYVSGIATLLPTLGVGSMGYPLTVISPGMNRSEIIRAMENMCGSFEQTILIGHPFFLKDVLESAVNNKLPIKKYRLRLLSCSESFNEEWREYVSRLFTSASTPQIFSTYGSSEFLLMGTETTFSIAVKRALEKNTFKCESFFGTSVVPSIFQYNPLMRYIESVGGELLFTANSGVPLIRYALGDRGELLRYDDAKKFLTKKQVYLSKWRLPLVTLRGRNDNAVVFYGANIYVEHVHSALEQKVFLPYLTGKFRMHVIYNKRMDAVLEINVELRDGVRSHTTLKKKLERGIGDHLKKINMEYRSSVMHISKNLIPHVKLHTYQSQPLFTPGMKTKFIIT